MFDSLATAWLLAPGRRYLAIGAVLLDAFETMILPRRASGEIRNEILQLVAMNQVDLIDDLIGNDRERVLIQRILADRRNLLDRFAF